MSADAVSPKRTAILSATVSIAVVFTLYVAVAFGFGLYLFALVVTSMREQLGFDHAAIGIVTGGAQVCYLAAALLCPRLVERFDGVAVIACATGVAGGLLVLLALVDDVVEVGLVLAGLGAAAAIMIVPTVGVIAKAVPVAYRSRVNGLVSSGTAYGQFANGLVVPWLLPGHGWRTVWLSAGATALAVAATGFVALRVFARDAFGRGMGAGAEAARPPEASKLLTAQNLIVWFIFALSGMACGPWQNYLASFLAEERGIPLAMIGQVWSLVGLVGLFSGFAAGLAADRFGIRMILALSYAALAGSALLVALDPGDWPLRGAGGCFGLSFYAAYGLVPAYITKTVDPRSATAVFAIANVFLGGGTMVGNVAGGYAPAAFGSLRGVYLACAALAALALIMALALRDERRPAVGAGPPGSV